jgi:hypothetical protein
LAITTADVRTLVIGDRQPLDEEIERYGRAGLG